MGTRAVHLFVASSQLLILLLPAHPTSQITKYNAGALAASPSLHQRFPNVTAIIFMRGIPCYRLSYASFAVFVMKDACHFTSLTRLDLSRAINLGFSDIAVLVHCTALQALSLPVTLSLPDYTLSVLRQLPSLRELSTGLPATSETARAALAQLTQLTSLRVRFLNGGGGGGGGNFLSISDQHGESFLHALLPFSQLSALDVNYCQGVFPVGMEGLRALTSLTLEGYLIEDCDLEHFTNMEYLRCFACGKLCLDAETVEDEHIFASVTLLKACKYVSVSLRLLSWFPRIESVSYVLASDLEIVSSAARLQHLGVKSEDGVDLSTELVHLSRLAKLESLCINGSQGVFTDVVVLSLLHSAGALRQLRGLRLESCADLTDFSLSLVAMCLTRLTELSFEKCRGFTAAGVSTLMYASPRLQRVCINSARFSAEDARACRALASAVGKSVGILHV